MACSTSGGRGGEEKRTKTSFKKTLKLYNIYEKSKLAGCAVCECVVCSGVMCVGESCVVLFREVWGAL